MFWRIFKVVFIVALLLGMAFPGQADFSAEGRAQEPEIRIISSSPERIVIEMSVPDYQIEQVMIENHVYDRVVVPGYSQSDEVGKPQVPVLGTLLGIPPMGEFSLEILSVESKMLKGSYELVPAPRPVLAEDEFAAGEWQYTKDQTAYLTDQVHPNIAARVGDEAWMRDQRLLRVEFFPFQYHARSEKLILNSRIRVALQFAGAVGFSSIALQPTEREDKNPFDSVFASNLLNYDQAREWRVVPEMSNRDLMVNEMGTAFISEPNDLPGSRIRIPISEDGIYQISYETLEILGFDVTQDPRYFHLDSQGREISIQVYNNDGDASKFSAGEYLLFYGQKFYGDFLVSEYYPEEDTEWLDTYYVSGGPNITFDAEFNAEMLEKYTDENVYWLSIGEVEGQRILPASPPASVLGSVSSYTETLMNEESHYWKTITFSGEDTWFWDMINVDPNNPVITRSYTTNLSAISTDSYTPTIHGEVIALSFNNVLPDDHHVQFYFNDPDHENLLYEEFWDGRSKLSFEFSVPQSSLEEGENKLDMVTNKTENMIVDILYFNWFEIDYHRNLQAINDQIIFTNHNPGAWTYSVSGFTNLETVNVLDVTNPINPKVIDFTGGVSNISFDIEHTSGASIIAGKVNNLTANQLSIYTPPDFSNESEYIIITHKEFLTTAKNLSDYRKTKGISSQVIDINDIYNQYNFGIYHPIAIKNFLRYAFYNWSTKPAYVVLVGDGHWNFKGYSSSESYGEYDKSTIYIPPNLAWIDPWKGETDSTNLLATIIGDDPLPDVMISRIPVNSETELTAIINKIKSFEAIKFAPWFDTSIFITDNTDAAGNFEYFANGIIQDYLIDGYRPIRIFQEDYDCELYSRCEEVANVITNTLNNNGALLVNYIGHGALWRWSNEQIFVDEDIGNLNNGNKLPVILSMTCWDGYFIYPGWEGLIEQMLRADSKGAVAAFSPTGLGVASGHDHLHRGFYDALIFQGENALGPLTQAAKLRLYQTGANFDLLHTFTIFGDPALQIPITNIDRVYLPAVGK